MLYTLITRDISHKMSRKLLVLRLYKDLLRETANFRSYYYKNYFTRKVRTEFRKNKDADEESSKKLFKKAEDGLAMLKRQTTIVNAYSESKLVIE